MVTFTLTGCEAGLFKKLYQVAVLHWLGHADSLPHLNFVSKGVIYDSPAAAGRVAALALGKLESMS